MLSAAAPQRQDDDRQSELSVDDLKARLLGSLRGALTYLFPAGAFRHGKFLVGDAQGNKGESLTVELTGSKAGMWHDFATKEGGDIISLWAVATGQEGRSSFPALLDDIRQWLGEPKR